MPKKRLTISKTTEKRAFQQAGSVCGFCPEHEVAALQIHHIDRDPSNNVLENLLVVCATCHAKITRGVISDADIHAKKRQVELRLVTSSAPRTEQPVLSIDFVDPPGHDPKYHAWLFRVKVAHTHPTKTVKGVRVYLKDIQCEDWKTKTRPVELDRMDWPHKLPEAGSEDNAKSHDVPPTPFPKLFDVLAAKHDYSGDEIRLAPYEDNPRQVAKSKVAQFAAASFNGPAVEFMVTILVTGEDVTTAIGERHLIITPEARPSLADPELRPRPPHWERRQSGQL